MCDGATNNGLISAPGQGGSLETGGGAGGVIILRSRSSVISSADSFIMADGAGRGGIIHLLAPAVNTTGTTISVPDGHYGNGDNPLRALPRSDGHGGGACDA